MIRKLAVAALAVSALLGPLAAATRAAAPPDTTPPAVSVLPARYVVGSTIDATVPESDGESYYTWSYRFAWTASDPSGICRQSVTEYSYEEMGSTGRVTPTLRGLNRGTNNFDFGRGGDSIVLHVTDCAGNKATSNRASAPGRIVEDDDSSLLYTGQWAVAHFSGFAGGTTHYTTQRGARMTQLVNGGSVALVMEQAANRGAADVYVDDVLRATVDTYSATTVHRHVVWEALLPKGTHTVAVVNRATPGHPRIDLDVIASN